MRIFDCRWLGCHGIGRFASELRSRLSGFAPLTLRGRPQAPLDPWLLGHHLDQVRADFFFSPGFNAPARTCCPFAFCVHDLNHLAVRESSSAPKRLYYATVIRPAIRRAAVVCTVSEFSRSTISEWARVPPGRIVNVSNGVSAAFTPYGHAARFSRPYYLYVGNHKPHKNFERLLRAFAACGLQRDFLLISTGAPSLALQTVIAKLRLMATVRFTGCVTDEELAALYRGAAALVLPSLYEGFGLPVLEAMSCGTAVIASTAAALPEVAGDAALLVDPLSIDAIASALVRLASDDALREELRARGLKRATRFSWDRTARRVELALTETVEEKEPACAWR